MDESSPKGAQSELYSCIHLFGHHDHLVKSMVLTRFSAICRPQFESFQGPVGCGAAKIAGYRLKTGSFGVPEQFKWALFEPIASHFGHCKATKSLENGLFGDQKSVKNGSKMCFSKDSFPLFGVHKEVE